MPLGGILGRIRRPLMWIAPASSAAVIIFDLEPWKNRDNATGESYVKRLGNRLRVKAEEQSDSQKPKAMPTLQRPDILRNITGEVQKEEPPPEKQAASPKTVECVIVVGTTGTGKSRVAIQ